MDMISSIAAVSIEMHTSQLQQDVGLAVSKKVMDIQEIAGNGLLNLMETTAPSFGHKLDTHA